MKQLGIILVLAAVLTSCVPDLARRTAATTTPRSFPGITDTNAAAQIDWRAYYRDTMLAMLIDTAIAGNQELNIVGQEIRIASNEMNARAGEVLPSVEVGAGAELEKSSRYTRNGAVEDQLEAAPGTRFPEPLSNLTIGARVSWEVDIWRKLRNATDAAAARMLSSVQGMQYLRTQLVAELATSYYELEALDNLLQTLDTTIAIQQRALEIVQQQKLAAKATELAVKKFEAEVRRNEGRRFDILQRIIETENTINKLCGRYPQRVARKSDDFMRVTPDSLALGLPSQLLEQRPDVQQASYELKASELDIDVAKARFYPTLNILAGFGYQAFSAQYIMPTPESMIFNLAGELIVPVLNRAAIVAAYDNAGARQIQAAYHYERTVLSAYVEVANQHAKVMNLANSVERKTRQVDALNQSIAIANDLFLNARADYMEVLMTQRDALDAKMELIETRLDQLRARVTLYRALGGGWK